MLSPSSTHSRLTPYSFPSHFSTCCLLRNFAQRMSTVVIPGQRQRELDEEEARQQHEAQLEAQLERDAASRHARRHATAHDSESDELASDDSGASARLRLTD